MHYHIRIIPVSGSSYSCKVILVVSVEVDDVKNAGPAVLDVSVVAPEVAVVSDGCVVGGHAFINLVVRVDKVNAPLTPKYH